MLDAIVDAIAIVAADGRIRWVNRGFQRLFGFPVEALLGEAISVIAGPFADQPEGGLLLDAVKEGAGAREVTAFSAAGTAIPVAVRVEVIESGDDAGCRVVSIVDMRNIRRLQADLVVKTEAVLRDRQLVRAIAESLGQPVLVLDDAERVALVNRSACEIFGFVAGEVLGRSLVRLDLPAAVRRAWLAFLASFRTETET
ncbi:MAG: PAS domain-containing protein, partial [Acidobacteriota bacterium]|nr:PAS domain-containing protein [Acidobacteriota bacterium]